jgi:hypothetical protein
MSVASSLLPSYDIRPGLRKPAAALDFSRRGYIIRSSFLVPAGENFNPTKYIIFPLSAVKKQPALFSGNRKKFLDFAAGPSIMRTALFRRLERAPSIFPIITPLLLTSAGTFLRFQRGG